MHTYRWVPDADRVISLFAGIQFLMESLSTALLLLSSLLQPPPGSTADAAAGILQANSAVEFLPLIAFGTGLGALALPVVKPSPFTLHPSPITPFTHHPSPITHHPSPFTHHPSPFTLHPSPFTLTLTLHPSPFALHPYLLTYLLTYAAGREVGRSPYASSHAAQAMQDAVGMGPSDMLLARSARHRLQR